MHVHVPDGVFPVWIWVMGIMLLVPIMSLALFFVRGDEKRLVMASAVSALLLIVFSLEFFGFHLNFTVLTGILLGPWWSLISISVVNFFLALFGHGGFTVVPINILLNWCEALVGFALFSLVIGRVKNISLQSFLSGVSVLLAMSVSFGLFLGVVYLTGVNPGALVEHEDTGVKSLNGVLGASGSIPLREFAAISLIPTLVGGVIEGIITGFAIRFILITKPGLVGIRRKRQIV